MIKAIRTRSEGLEIFKEATVSSMVWQGDYAVYVRINGSNIWSGTCDLRDDATCVALREKACLIRDQIIDKYILVDAEVLDLRHLIINENLEVYMKDGSEYENDRA